MIATPSFCLFPVCPPATLLSVTKSLEISFILQRYAQVSNYHHHLISTVRLPVLLHVEMLIPSSPHPKIPALVQSHVVRRQCGSRAAPRIPCNLLYDLCAASIHLLHTTERMEVTGLRAWYDSHPKVSTTHRINTGFKFSKALHQAVRQNIESIIFVYYTSSSSIRSLFA